MKPARTCATSVLLGVMLAGCGPASPPVDAPATHDAARADAPVVAHPEADAPLVEADAAGADTAADPAADGAANADEASPAVAADALDHAGPVLIGQRMTELQEAGTWNSAGLLELLGNNCEQYDGGSLPAGVALMALADQVARFEIGPLQEDGAALPPGPYGVAVGMPVERARALLPPGAVETPHAYDPEGGRYLTWRDPGSDLAIRLEVFDGKVTLLYWGSSESVEMIEGCA